jgi:excisionase family DNA binding protein
MAIHSARPHVPSLLPATGSETRLLLTLDEAALSLSVSKRTLERLIAGGAFPPPLKIGRSSRVPREDISSYLELLRRQRGDKIGTS